MLFASSDFFEAIKKTKQAQWLAFDFIAFIDSNPVSNGMALGELYRLFNISKEI